MLGGLRIGEWGMGQRGQRVMRAHNRGDGAAAVLPSAWLTPYAMLNTAGPLRCLPLAVGRSPSLKGSVKGSPSLDLDQPEHSMDGR